MAVQDFLQNESVGSLAGRMIRRITKEQHLEGFTDRQVYRILAAAKEQLEKLGALIKVGVPIIIFGDIHGQLGDLLRYFETVGTPADRQMLFLGDYVDRGAHSFEVIMLLLCYKVLHPTRTHLLRGNHECFKMNRIYGFHEELKRKRSLLLWRIFFRTRILCMHGGISEHVHNWQDLENLDKPRRPKECDEGIALDLMWADPTQSKCTTFSMNTARAISVIFGEKATTSFLETLKLDMVVRAHEVSKDGFTFFFNKKLVTVFSAPFYCGTDGNSGAIMKLSADFAASFVILRPRLVRSQILENIKALQNNYEAMAAPSPDPRSRIGDKAAVKQKTP
ncbi:unnamed protein product [Caenorhabditis auriculariae]|uniref:Serine/threonine-protein phosphatase n=1 Tax=Caenorhabditis auriculariae TaxID=2777116 RepID=A0A8S1GUE9_9PELO|nr:unnamed protein product [Caenorhabditis auriculariae]